MKNDDLSESYKITFSVWIVQLSSFVFSTAVAFISLLIFRNHKSLFLELYDCSSTRDLSSKRELTNFYLFHKLCLRLSLISCALLKFFGIDYLPSHFYSWQGFKFSLECIQSHNPNLSFMMKDLFSCLSQKSDFGKILAYVYFSNTWYTYLREHCWK